MRLILSLLLVTAAFYIGGAVLSAEFHPFKWAKDDREMISALWILAVLITAMLTAKGGPFDTQRD
jgi:ABC-type thiamin/hydroxymethylpyrimidine transport system permease subunit